MIGPEQSVSVVIPCRTSGHRVPSPDASTMLTPAGEHEVSVMSEVLCNVNVASMASPATA